MGVYEELNGGAAIDSGMVSSRGDDVPSSFSRRPMNSRAEWFPVRRKGQIVLQDHDAGVWFRSIKIRETK